MAEEDRELEQFTDKELKDQAFNALARKQEAEARGDKPAIQREQELSEMLMEELRKRNRGED